MGSDEAFPGGQPKQWPFVSPHRAILCNPAKASQPGKCRSGTFWSRSTSGDAKWETAEQQRLRRQSLPGHRSRMIPGMSSRAHWKRQNRCPTSSPLTIPVLHLESIPLRWNYSQSWKPKDTLQNQEHQAPARKHTIRLPVNQHEVNQLMSNQNETIPGRYETWRDWYLPWWPSWAAQWQNSVRW